jgi:hypothetical protein
MCIETSCVSADNADALILLACSSTSSAEDALVVVSYDRSRGSIDREIILYAFIVVSLLDSVTFAECLKLAVCGSDAAEAVLIVIGQDQLKSLTSVVFDLLSIGICYHTVCAWIYAGSDESSSSYYLTYAHSAGTDLIDASQIAQCRYVDAGLVGCIQ